MGSSSLLTVYMQVWAPFSKWDEFLRLNLFSLGAISELGAEFFLIVGRIHDLRLSYKLEGATFLTVG